MSNKPSLRDVAKQANVSLGTVSNVLNRPTSVSEETRKKVREAIDMLGLRFGRINNDDSITNLGQFGFPDSENVRGRNIPSEEWRSVNSPEVQIIAGLSKEKWTPDTTMYVATLRDRGVIQGHLTIHFHKAISESQKHHTAEAIEDLCVPLSLYLSFVSNPYGNHGGVTPYRLKTAMPGLGN
jgi:hypothetical protein